MRKRQNQANTLQSSIAGAVAVRDVTQSERLTYQRDGVVLLQDIYPLPWVNRLATQLDDVFRLSAARSAAFSESLIGGRQQTRFSNGYGTSC